MDQKRNFRLRLNLFDGLVLLVALAAGAVLLWTNLKPAPTPADGSPAVSTVRYTVRFQKWLEGTGSLVQEGDKLVDNIKNFELGQVVSAEVVPAISQQLDQNNRQFVLTAIPGHEDVLVTVESPCTATDEAITLGGGFTLRVGSIAYIRGEGYMASGPIIAIEREGL